MLALTRAVTLLAGRIRSVLCATEVSQLLDAVTCGRRQVMKKRGCGRSNIAIRGEEGCRKHSRRD
jgi:hypothetical protein